MRLETGSLKKGKRKEELTNKVRRVVVPEFAQQEAQYALTSSVLV